MGADQNQNVVASTKEVFADSNSVVGTLPKTLSNSSQITASDIRGLLVDDFSNLKVLLSST